MATLSTSLRNALADLYGNLDRLEIIDTDGTTVLATITVAFGGASSGQVSDDPASVNAVASGTAAEARLYSNASPTDEITGLTVSATGGGGDVELDNTSIANGQAIDMSSITITQPATL